TGSTERKVRDVIAREQKSSWEKIQLTFAKDFFDHPLFVEAWSRMIPTTAKDHSAHVVFSFHGLPESQVRKNKSCEINSSCCERLPTPRCYRAQCFRTAHAIAEKSGLVRHQYSIAFQSRLGRQKWLEPSTDHAIAELAKSGIKHLYVLCPSFVTDCLETLEEIGMGQKENFLEHGGQEFHLIPCLNAEPFWIDACQKMFVPESLRMEKSLKQNNSESTDNLSRV
ncbi:MAG TPA: ferrochelatase, partial [Pseudobdellovibrionaceae bacterium]|nr:ferrochelatase [Pseudobdellovibrionaceae bacterium]